LELFLLILILTIGGLDKSSPYRKTMPIQKNHAHTEKSCPYRKTMPIHFKKKWPVLFSLFFKEG